MLPADVVDAVLDQSQLNRPEAIVTHLLNAESGLSSDVVAEALKEAVIRARTRDAQRALEIAGLILHLAARTENPLHRALGLRTQAFVYLLDLKDYSQASDLYDQARTIYQDSDDELGLALVDVTRVWALASLGRYDQAYAAGDWAREVLARHRQWRALATLSNNLAAIYGQRKEYGRTLEMLDEAQRAYRELGEEAERARMTAEFNRARVLTYLGRFEESVALNRDAIKRAEALGMTISAARGRHNLGETLFVAGRPNEAIAELDHARAAYLADERQRDAVLLDLELVGGLLYLGRYEEALSRNPRVLSLAEEMGVHTEMAQAYIHNAKASMGLGRFAEARVALDAARRCFEEQANDAGVVTADLELALLLQLEGKPAEALTVAEKCLAFAQQHVLPLETARARLIGSQAAVALGRLADARILAQGALDIAEAQHNVPLLYRANHLLGQVTAAEGCLTDALSLYDRAIEMLERLQHNMITEFRPAFLADKDDVYADAVTVCLETNDPARAVLYAERAKSRALLHWLSHRLERPLAARVVADQPLVEELAALRRERDILLRRWESGDLPTPQEQHEAQEQLYRYESKLTELWHRLLIRDAAYAEDAALSQVRTETAQPYLDEQTVLVEYYAVKQELLAFVITAEKVTAVPLDVTMSQLQKQQQLLQLNWNTLQRTGRPEYLVQNAQAILRRCHEFLFAPLASLCRPFQRLVFVPHGSLHYLPLHALHDGERYLLEQFQIRYLPGSSFIGLYQSMADAGTGALVLGHTSGGRLPQALHEAQEVARQFGAELWLEEEATRAAFADAAPIRRVLHLATHGDFRADNPLFSGLTLADGWLTTLDIFNLRLQASLVVLSACQTGRSIIGGGDEVMGLMRAFLAAGAASLVLTLWPVHDEATSHFMHHFYGSLREGQRRDEALRRAQLHLLQDSLGATAHPYFWAPFYLVGKGSPLFDVRLVQGGI